MQFILILLFLVGSKYAALAGEIDNFESLDSWRVVASDGVKAEIRACEGKEGRGLRLEYDFARGTGFCVLRRELPLDLPAEYRFGFQIRGDSPPNNLEFKLLDPSGENVWWVNQRAYEFPSEWKKVTLRSRRIQFAWGPSGGKTRLEKLGAIEFAIAASSGGKGTIDLDQLTFEAIPPRGEPKPIRVSFGHNKDGKPEWVELPADWKINAAIETSGVGWAQPTTAASTQSATSTGTSTTIESVAPIEPVTSTGPAAKTQPAKSAQSPAQTRWAEPTLQPTILLELGGIREFGGLIIDWDETHHPDDLDIDASLDGTNFETVAQARGLRGGRRYFQIPDGEAAFLRVRILAAGRPAPERPGQSPAATGVRLTRLELAPPEFGQSANAMWSRIARDAPRGWYPRYFLGEQQPWTVIGVEGDDNEALMDAAGAIELGKGGPRLEPFLYIDGKLITWADVSIQQKLKRTPAGTTAVAVEWKWNDLLLEITSICHDGAGRPNYSAIYAITSTGVRKSGKLFLAIRPFQVLPPWHELNLIGGATRLRTIQRAGTTLLLDQYMLVTQGEFSEFSASNDATGDIVEFLSRGKLPDPGFPGNESSSMSAALEFDFDVGTGELMACGLSGIFGKPGSKGAHHDAPLAKPNATKITKNAAELAELSLPAAAAPIAETFRRMQDYILINADGPRIQPGSRTYERSWIRDGALTGTALLVTGHGDKMRDFLDWYAPFQYENGKIPCVVDSRGPDPVPENDSHGEYIYAVATYYRFTHDREFLNRHFPRVAKAVEYIESLRAQRMTDEFKTGPVEKRMLYGLVPESISHEGYSAKPMHSYWDGFFTLRGLSDAAYLAREVQVRGTEHVAAGLRPGRSATRPTNPSNADGPDSDDSELPSGLPIVGWDESRTRDTAANDPSTQPSTQTAGAEPGRYTGDAANLSAKWQSLADDYRKCMYDSMRLTMDLHKIDYIPGCAELGDFDATSTAIGVFPCSERDRAPEPQLTNTFDRYLKFFRDRRDGKIEWREFTPYELRLVGVFVRLGRVEEAHELLDWFMQYQQPAGWRQWGEVAYRDPLYPGFVGDMPHTWVGGEFVNSVRAMLVYEDEAADALIVAAGVPWRWLNSPDGVSFENFPTECGPLSASLKLEDGNKVRVRMSGLSRTPAGGIVLKTPKKPSKVEFPAKATKFEIRADGVWLQEMCPEVLIHVQE